MMKQDTIHIHDLSIGYRTKNDTKLVASHIQARIYSGELTCLLGANGVGKSTLLRTLSAFQPKLEGEIAVLGRDVDSYSDKELSTTIGVVLTEKCDIRNMSVRELVEMGRSPYTGFSGAVGQGGQASRRKIDRSGTDREPGLPHGAYPLGRRTAEGHDRQGAGSGNTCYLSGRADRFPRFSE